MSTFLIGARAIAGHLEELGLLPKDDPGNEDRVYYMALAKKIPVGKFGNQLISTPDKLQQVVSKLVS
jgi:hypothetical protein